MDLVLHKVRVEVTNKHAWEGEPSATAKIYIGEKLVATIEATTERSQGADSGWYAVAHLKEKILKSYV